MGKIFPCTTIHQYLYLFWCAFAFLNAFLDFAIADNRDVLTINRSDFIRLHNLQPSHAGIIVCTEDLNRQRLALQINEAITKAVELTN